MSNGRLTKHLEYESYEAPMMVHALRIAANTALMCGHDGARARLQEMIGDVMRNVPDIARLFDEEDFAEMGRALQDLKDNDTVLVCWQTPAWVSRWSREGELHVSMGGKKSWWTRRAKVLRDSPDQAALAAYLKHIARADIRIETSTFEEV